MKSWLGRKVFFTSLQLVLASLALSLAAGVFLSWQEQARTSAAVLSELERQRTYRVRSFTEWLAYQGQKLKLFEFFVEEPPENLEPLLRKYANALSSATHLFLLDPKLRILYSTDPRSRMPEWTKDSWLTEALRVPANSPVLADSLSGTPLIRVALPLRSRELKTVYVLAAELYLQEAGFAFSRQLKADEFAYAVVPGRTWLFKPPAITELPVFQEPDYIDLALAGEEFTGTYKNFRGFPVWGTYYFDQDLHAAFFVEKIIPPWTIADLFNGLWFLFLLLPASGLLVLLQYLRLRPWSLWSAALTAKGQDALDRLPPLGNHWKELEGPLRISLENRQDLLRNLHRQVIAQRSALEVLPDLLVEFSDKGVILDVNETVTTLLGMEKSELLGEPLEKFSSDLIPLESKLPLILHAPKNHRFYTWILLKNGQKKLLEAVPARTGREPLRYFLSLRDVTERFTSGESLRQQKKMESLFNFSAGVVQDFSNLLAGISGRLALAALDAERGRVDKESLNEAQRMIMDARSLTQDLVTVGSGGVYDLKPLDVLPVLESAVNRARAQGLKVFINLLPHHGLVKADPAKLEVIFQEILDNARDFAGTEKPVRITSDMVLVPSTNTQIPDQKFLRISFLDQGPGISLENLEKIYDPYFTTRQGKKGLGLTVVYSQLRRMGGSVEIESEEGSGTEVRIYFPASDAD